MRDVIGNELKVGDLVAIQLERPLIFGEIVEINEGGVLLAGQQGKMEPHPGRVVIMCKQALLFDPRAHVGAVLALRDDAHRVKIGSENKEQQIDQTLPN